VNNTNENYNYNELDLEENNSKESNDDYNAFKIPTSDFNKNNLNKIPNKEGIEYFSENISEELYQTNLISTSRKDTYPKTKINPLNELKEFNSNDNSFTKTFSPKNYNSNKINNNFSINNLHNIHNCTLSKFPKIHEKYSDIANILKKDINETLKKEKEKELDVDITRKYSSLSNNVNNNTTANTNDSNLIMINEKKMDEIKEKKVNKLNLIDILSGSINKEE